MQLKMEACIAEPAKLGHDSWGHMHYLNSLIFLKFFITIAIIHYTHLPWLLHVLCVLDELSEISA